MGIELFNNNRPLFTKRITGNHLLSHDDNNALLIVDNNIADTTLFVSSHLSPGFSTKILQRGTGKALLQTYGAGITLVKKNGVAQTAVAGDILSLYGSIPNEFVVQRFGTSSDPSGGGSSSIKVVSADFKNATDYDNADILGQNLGIFFNQVNKYLEDDEWQFTATGIRILIAGFDATANAYTFFISTVTTGALT